MMHPHFMLIQYRDINVLKCKRFRRLMSVFECCAMVDDDDVREFFDKVLPDKLSYINRHYSKGAPLVLSVEHITASVSYEGFDFIRFCAIPITGVFKADTYDGSLIGLLMDYMSMGTDKIVDNKNLID